MDIAHGELAPILPERPVWRIGYAEIAALARVQRPVPTTWSRRYADFPAPVASVDGRPLFDGGQIVAWLKERKLGNAEPRELDAEPALHTLSSWRAPGAGGAGLAAPGLVGALTALLCLRRQLDAELRGRTWEALLKQAAELDPEDFFLLSELHAVPDPARTGPALAVLADELTEAAFSPAEAFDWVLDARRRIGSTDLAIDRPGPAVLRALVELSGAAALPEESVIGTPCAGAGDLLAALHAAAPEDSAHTYLAADPDPVKVRLIRRRMLTRGVFELNLDIVDGEDLDVETWGNPDVLACVLPYEAGEVRDARKVLERVEALTDYLDKGATAVVLGPADALAGPLAPNGEADLLRRWFLRDGLLKAVISLPDGALPYRVGYRTAIWVLRRAAQDERPTGRVFLADYAARPLTEETLAALTEDFAIWRESRWRGDERHQPRHAAITHAAELDDRPGAAFLPNRRAETVRHTRQVVERPARIADLEQTLADLDEAARRLPDPRSARRVRAVLRPEDKTVPYTSVRRLLKDRRLRKRPGHRLADEHLTAEGHYRVITAAEVLGETRPGGRRIDRGVLLTGYEQAQFTEPGDLVVTTVPRFGVHVDEEGTCVVATPARILRVVPGSGLRPRVLAALLRAAAAEHARTDGAVRASRAVEDLPIPVLSQEETARFDAVLDELTRRAELLREQSAALADLASLTAAGLADGTLTLQSLPERSDY